MEGYSITDPELSYEESAPRPSEKYQSDYRELRKAVERVQFSGMSEDQAKAAKIYLRDKVNEFIDKHKKVEDYYTDDYKDQAEASVRKFRNAETLQQWKTLLKNPQEAARRYAAEIRRQVEVPEQPDQTARPSESQQQTQSDTFISMEQFLTQSPREGVVGRSSQGYTARWVKTEDGGWDLVTSSQDPMLAKRAVSALTTYFTANFQEKIKDNEKTYEIKRGTTPYMFNIGDDYFALKDGRINSRQSNTHVWNTSQAKEARATGMYYIWNNHLIYPDGTAIPNNNYDVETLNKDLSAAMKIKREELEKARGVEREYRNQWLKAWEEVIKPDRGDQGLTGADSRTNREKFALRAYLDYVRAKVNKTEDEKRLLNMVDGTGGQVKHYPEFIRRSDGTYKHGPRNAPVILLRPALTAPQAQPEEFEAN